MRQDLDELLCKKYPLIFANRYKSMQETAMCWGFSCGDGWFTIIDSLCASIQSHIDWKKKRRQYDIEHNAIYTDLMNGDESTLRHKFSNMTDEFIISRKEEILEEGLRDIKSEIVQVQAAQVKEKFGTLRFYIDGGDEVTHGMIRVAENMSAHTCEVCGSPGQTRVSGYWHYTSCDAHARGEEIYEYDRDEQGA